MINPELPAAASANLWPDKLQTKLIHVEFEILTVVVMKGTIFLSITPCSLLAT
jgi:hypothetical protein